MGAPSKITTEELILSECDNMRKRTIFNKKSYAFSADDGREWELERA